MGSLILQLGAAWALGYSRRGARWVISFASVAFGSALLCTGLTVTANAAEIKVCTIRAGMTVLTAIGPEFERSSHNKLDVLYDPTIGGGCGNRVNAGESIDVVMGNSAGEERLERAGKIIAGSRANLAFNAMGVEVRAGASKPDVSSIETLKRTLLNAKSIGYIQPNRVDELIERLGLTDAVKSKIVVPKTDIVSELIAKGELELGIVFITQILTTPGVEFVGPLPADVQYRFQFTAAVPATSKAPDAARDLIKFLTTPAAVAVFKAQGMEVN
jgi:molybdate transport system substrate-binding protein